MKIKYSIEGLACPNCASKLATLLAEATGAQVKINFLTKSLTLEGVGDTPQLDETVRRTVLDFSADVTVEKKA